MWVANVEDVTNPANDKARRKIPLNGAQVRSTITKNHQKGEIMPTPNQYSVDNNMWPRRGVILWTFVFLVFVTSGLSFATTITYQHDALNRLQAVDYGNGVVESYTYDSAGNRTALTMTSDVSPPVLTATSADIVLSSGNATLTGVASDIGSGVQKVEVSFDGQTWYMATGTTNWSYTWSTQAGVYTVCLKVTDDAENSYVTSQGVTITSNPVILYPDILWRNTSTGQNAVWYMEGETFIESASVNAVSDQNWKIVGTGDFNSDGKTDILWRNTSTGQNLVWYMNGVTYISYASINAVTDQNWKIVGTGDFDADGKTDILWRNTSTGQNAVWYMNGVTFISSAYTSSVADQNWKIVGTGDFNSDGKTDILWRNTSTGQNLVWYMNGVTYVSNAYSDTVADQNWKIVGTGDFNADGKTDILWRNTSTGENVVWYMNGIAVAGGVQLDTSLDTSWQIVGTANFNDE
jgi:YD repeat-containing protein